MKLKPVITEKSLQEAKNGNYTFFVGLTMAKPEIKKIIEDLFKVTVVKVRTINYQRSVRRSYTGRKVVTLGRKKAIVTLSGKDKIDLFEEKKGKGKAK